MVQYDVYSGTITLAVATAVIDDTTVSFPSMLYAGQVGTVTGTAVNTGTVPLTLRIDMVDLATGQVIGSAGPVATTPQSPFFGFSVTFTMPNRNLNFELRLHD